MPAKTKPTPAARYIAAKKKIDATEAGRAFAAKLRADPPIAAGISARMTAVQAKKSELATIRAAAKKEHRGVSAAAARLVAGDAVQVADRTDEADALLTEIQTLDAELDAYFEARDEQERRHAGLRRPVERAVAREAGLIRSALLTAAVAAVAQAEKALSVVREQEHEFVAAVKADGFVVAGIGVPDLRPTLRRLQQEAQTCP